MAMPTHPPPGLPTGSPVVTTSQDSVPSLHAAGAPSEVLYAPGRHTGPEKVNTEAVLEAMQETLRALTVAVDCLGLTAARSSHEA